MIEDKEPLPALAIWLREAGGSWYGIAGCAEELVATSVGKTRDEAAHVLSSCLPDRARGLSLEEGPESSFADETAAMLAAIEERDESGKRFSISRAWVPEPAASVYRLAAAIPLGYACSYGRIASIAGTIAREVGRLMACNPLYPLVPCHRVVGSDYSLVGYRGAKEGPDLDDKLARLRAEARGHREDLLVGEGESLMVFPVERVIARAERRSAADRRQLPLF